jgi:hypothetical protein
MRQLTYPKLQWLLQLTAALKLFPIPIYFPNFAPSDFLQFPKLKAKLHGRRFGSNEGVMEAANEFFQDQNRDIGRLKSKTISWVF